jgi:hypothetical protein
VKPWRREPVAAVVLAAFAFAVALGSTWGLPGTSSWAADAISPRSCGLGAIVESFTPGHFHVYPPLHMALLTVLSAPWMLLAGSRVGFGPDALGAELIKPLYMTGIEVGARLLAAAMALGVVWNTMRLWTRLRGHTAGLAAGAFAAANAVFVFYAHTGNLEVPYLFWLTCALVEIDRVAAGEPREGRALLYGVAAALTKDQAAGALVLPIVVYVLLVPWLERRASPTRRSLVRGAIVAIGAFALGSGAVVNPSGYARRISVLFGPASQTWAEYPRGLHGALLLARDAVALVPRFTSWPIALAAAVGVVIALRERRPERWRTMLPLLAAASFTLLFNLGARRTDVRFLLPQSVFLFPYAAVTFEAWWSSKRSSRALVALGAVAALAPALLGVASMDATLLFDARYEAERFLAALPAGTHVEVLGGPIFLPRVPAALVAVRPGVEPVAERQQLAGITELVDPLMDPRSRAPQAIVLATELSAVEEADPNAPASPFGVIHGRDPVSRGLLRGLLDGSLGYRRALRATCSVPWPLACVKVHGSTGGEAWVYVPAR